MPFVLDASVAACWAFADEDHPVAAQALDRIRADTAIVPALWQFELRNTLIVNERRGRLQSTDTDAFLADIAQLGIAIDDAPEDGALLRLARQHRLTVYDAAYLELALRLACPLATLDAGLRDAAKAAGAMLLEQAPA